MEEAQEIGFNPWVEKIPWSRKWQSTPVFLTKEPHGQRSLVGYSQWGHKESGMTENTHTKVHNIKHTILTIFNCTV